MKRRKRSNALKAIQSETLTNYSPLTVSVPFLYQITGGPLIPPKPTLDEINQRIIEIVTSDPDITDAKLGKEIGLTRPATNTRRKQLERLGYKVR